MYTNSNSGDVRFQESAPSFCKEAIRFHDTFSGGETVLENYRQPSCAIIPPQRESQGRKPILDKGPRLTVDDLNLPLEAKPPTLGETPISLSRDILQPKFEAPHANQSVSSLREQTRFVVTNGVDDIQVCLSNGQGTGSLSTDPCTTPLHRIPISSSSKVKNIEWSTLLASNEALFDGTNEVTLEVETMDCDGVYEKYTLVLVKNDSIRPGDPHILCLASSPQLSPTAVEDVLCAFEPPSVSSAVSSDHRSLPRVLKIRPVRFPRVLHVRPVRVQENAKILATTDVESPPVMELKENASIHPEQHVLVCKDDKPVASTAKSVGRDSSTANSPRRYLWCPELQPGQVSMR